MTRIDKNNFDPEFAMRYRMIDKAYLAGQLPDGWYRDANGKLILVDWKTNAQS